jgi:hypothetical protein
MRYMPIFKAKALRKHTATLSGVEMSAVEMRIAQTNLTW